MKKRALGATLVAAGMVFHAMPASADKLDDVLSRLDAIEKNNAKLATENAALKARLNKVEVVKPASAAPAHGSGPAVSCPASPPCSQRGHRPRRSPSPHRKSTPTVTASSSTRKAIPSPSTRRAARSPVTATSTSRSTTRRRRSAEISTPTPLSPVKASPSRSEISAGCRRSRATAPISACAASSAFRIFRSTSSTSSNSASTFPQRPA